MDPSDPVEYSQNNVLIYLEHACLTLFGLGFCQPKNTGGGGILPPPNLAISSQKTMKLGKGIPWVESFTNWQKFFDDVIVILIL